jgi:hypothetical protein
MISYVLFRLETCGAFVDLGLGNPGIRFLEEGLTLLLLICEEER